MVKRTARGRQSIRSAKSTRTNEGNRKNDDIDWNISSGDESGEEDVVLNSVSDHSEKEEEEEVKETIEEKKLRLAKEYLNKVRLEEEEASGSDVTDDEGVEERIEKRLQREAEEARGRIFKEVAEQLKDADLPAGRFCKGHLMSVTSTDISGDEKSIVSGGKDCKACLWDVESGKVVTIFEGKRERKDSPKRRQLNCHRGEVLAVQISYDGKYVVTAGREGLIRIWDSRCGQSVGEAALSPAVSPHRSIVHATDCKEVLRGHRGMVTSLLLQRDNVLYSGGLDTTVKLWNIVDTTYIDTLYGHEATLTALSGARTAVSRGATRVLSCATDNSLRLWKVEAATQVVFRGRRVDQSLECCALVTPQSFVAGDLRGSLHVFSVNKKKPVFSVKNAHGVDSAREPGGIDEAGRWVVSCAALPSTNVLASGSYDDAIRLWDVNATNRAKDGVLLREVRSIPIKGFVNSLSFAPSGRFVVAGIGQEHRMGRWWRLRGVKNGIFIQNLNLDLSVLSVCWEQTGESRREGWSSQNGLSRITSQ